MTDLRAITVKQPWAWAIARGGKNIENRSRGTSYRGLLAIHAGMAWSDRGATDPRFYVSRCLDCGLPDPYRGDGDGIGSCECSRCAECGAPPQGCDCAWAEDDWSDDEPDDDSLPADADYVRHNGRAQLVETTSAPSEAGLL